MPFRRITISQDGSVLLCCNDFTKITVMGNAFTENLVAIWDNSLFNIYRLRLFNKNRNSTGCDGCDMGPGVYSHLLPRPTFGKEIDKEILGMKFFDPNK
jgi:hypothetical protein